MRKAISVTRRKASGKLQIHCYYELTLKERPFNGPAKKSISDNQNCQTPFCLLSIQQNIIIRLGNPK